MRRKLFTLAAAASAVLCAAACAAWPAGYWRTAELGRHVEEPDATLYDHLGDIYQKLNQSGKARDAWKKSIEIEPSPEVEKKLKSINEQVAPGRAAS